MKHILLTNDDGINAPGLRILYEQLQRRFDSVSVVAPDRNLSASSHSLTLINPLRVERGNNGFLSVNGTPADCIGLAVDHLVKPSPQVVVSGINAGPNLGNDILYSGTVAGAIEARQKGLPGIAVSLTGKAHRHYDTAAAVVGAIIDNIGRHPLPPDQVLNVNVPDVPMSVLKGLKVTRLGQREQPEPMVATEDPWGRPIYWHGKLGQPKVQSCDTDFNAIEAGFASVTPLTVDFTAYQTMATLTQWINEVELS